MSKAKWVLGLVVLAGLLLGCTATPGTPVSPVATPTPEVKVPVIDERPDEGERFRPMFHAVSHAMADWTSYWVIPATTHLHRLDLVKQLRRVDNGQVLRQERIVTGILGKDYEPEPGREFAAAWEYDLDLEAEFGVTEAEEWVKPVLVCVREPGDEEPCLCRLVDGGPLEDCTELTGRCEGWAEYPEQAADGFCFTNFYSELPQLFKTWLPLVIVEEATE